MKKSFCFRGSAAKRAGRTPMADWCVFCDIARRAPASTTALLYSVPYTAPLTFSDLKPWHLSICLLNVRPSALVRRMTRSSRSRTSIRRPSVSHMVKVGKDLLSQDAPESEEHRFGFHQPPFNSIDHLHLHCLALPFIPRY
ncbi:histidine triad nucleotide-binding protein 3 [Hordeum vulgare]|nr:histidine triad nucleotide-binding protein 3 [Hordeum vulgare]